MVIPNKWYYFDWTFGEFYRYGIILGPYGFTFATPLFAINIMSKEYPGPKFGWGIWRRRGIAQGDFLYKYHGSL
jgi:hypothetical protein